MQKPDDLLSPKAVNAAAKYLRETMQAGKKLTPWDTTLKATKKKWLVLAEGAIKAAIAGGTDAEA